MIDTMNVDEATLNLALQMTDNDFQMDMFQEECAEAIVAVNHLRRNRANVDELAGEIADVFIMCHKMAKVIGVHLVDQQVIFKMKRLREKIAATLREKAGK